MRRSRALFLGIAFASLAAGQLYREVRRHSPPPAVSLATLRTDPSRYSEQEIRVTGRMAWSSMGGSNPKYLPYTEIEVIPSYDTVEGYLVDPNLPFPDPNKRKMDGVAASTLLSGIRVLVRANHPNKPLADSAYPVHGAVVLCTGHWGRDGGHWQLWIHSFRVTDNQLALRIHP